MLTAPQQCSTFLTKHERVLTESNSSCAQYLFQKDKFYDTTYDTGDKHIQCGRRADVFKFWFMWKAKVKALPPPSSRYKKIMYFLNCFFLKVFLVKKTERIEPNLTGFFRVVRREPTVWKPTSTRISITPIISPRKYETGRVSSWYWKSPSTRT